MTERGGKGKRKVSGLCETFRVGWSMMVGLDFWKKKAEDGGSIAGGVCVSSFFFSLMKVCRRRFFCVFVGGLD